MKSDARVRYTKMIIKNSFVKLLKEKTLNKITVKDICDLAEMNRATFYKHYCDVFDLMYKIEEQSIFELEQIIQNSNYKKISDVFEQMLNKVKEDGDLYMTLFSKHGDNTFPTKIFELCYEKASLSIEKSFPNISKTKQKWLYYFMAQGCSAILNCWINNKMKEETKEVALFIDELCDKVLNSIDRL